MESAWQATLWASSTKAAGTFNFSAVPFSATVAAGRKSPHSASHKISSGGTPSANIRRATSRHEWKSVPGSTDLIRGEKFELLRLGKEPGTQPLGVEQVSGRIVVRRHQKGLDLGQRDAQPDQIGEPDAGEAADF